jgi:vacuolar-type H+-ATPase subunit I/STV1
MVNEHVVCPACGLDVPDGRFCKFCGKPLHPEIAPDQEVIDETIPLKPDKQSENSTQAEKLVKFDFAIEGMNSKDQSLLLSKVELAILAKELDLLIEQIRATRYALHLEHADTLKIAARTEVLREALEKAKSRRRDLLALKDQLELEDLLFTLEEKQSKLAMLEDLTGSIEQDVYDEKHHELQESIKNLKSQLKKQTKTAKNWIKAMEKKIKSFHKELSRLTAQHKMGDISASRFEKSKTKIIRSLSLLDGGCEILQGLIEQSECLQRI